MWVELAELVCDFVLRKVTLENHHFILKKLPVIVGHAQHVTSVKGNSCHRFNLVTFNIRFLITLT